ncbi:MAG: hypothetical protein K2K96_06075 [Lachnospiraceae bacterium]|nr:hypothetical protein [Lachnospiraceae bacterium]
MGETRERETAETIVFLTKTFFIILFIWFLLCQIHVIYHYAITIYRNEWIVGRTREEVEMRYGEPDNWYNIWSLYDPPACLTNAAGAEFINALRIIPFYPGKRHYIVKYDDEGIAYWAGYDNCPNEGV